MPDALLDQRVLTAQQPVATESAFLCDDEPHFFVGRISSGQARTCVKLPATPRHTAIDAKVRR
jgi:hypothetical protein